MAVAVYVIGQPTTGYAFHLRENGVDTNLTGYTFTINLTNEVTGGTTNYLVPASTSTTASFDLADVTSSATPITAAVSKWTGRVWIESGGNPYNVTEDLTVVVIT